MEIQRRIHLGAAISESCTSNLGIRSKISFFGMESLPRITEEGQNTIQWNWSVSIGEFSPTGFYHWIQNNALFVGPCHLYLLAPGEQSVWKKWYSLCRLIYFQWDFNGSRPGLTERQWWSFLPLPPDQAQHAESSFPSKSGLRFQSLRVRGFSQRLYSPCGLHHRCTLQRFQFIMRYMSCLRSGSCEGDSEDDTASSVQLALCKSIWFSFGGVNVCKSPLNCSAPCYVGCLWYP